jgi:hypothetical protein
MGARGRHRRWATAVIVGVMAACTACGENGGSVDGRDNARGGEEAVDAGDLYGAPDEGGSLATNPLPASSRPAPRAPLESTPAAPLRASSPGLVPISAFRDEQGRYLGPWAAYSMTLDEMAFVIDAERLITVECMRRLGYDVDKEFDSGSDETAVGVDAYRGDPQWGVIDLDRAREYGYGSDFGIPLLRSPSAEPRREHPAGFREALDGEGGCAEISYDLAHRDVEGLSSEDNEAIGEYFRRADEASRASPSMREAIAGWAACMEREGFDYADPAAALNAGWPEGAASAQETETAVADVECKIEVDFISRWDRARYDAEESLIAEYLPVFEKRGADNVRVHNNALAIIAGEVTLDDSPLWPALRDV